jgi:acyl-ACP thioesterase
MFAEGLGSGMHNLYHFKSVKGKSRTLGSESLDVYAPFCHNTRMNNIYSMSFPLAFSAVDRLGGLTLSRIFDYFQEAATFHAEELGCGKADTEKVGQGWVLSRQDVAVDRRPRYKDPVTVRSWPRGAEKLFAVRDYDIRDADDKPLVRARSGWLILDIKKRIPLRVAPLMQGLPLNEGIDSLPPEERVIPSLKPCPSLEKAGERKAAYSDVDSNGHMNNARYVEWVQDVTEASLLENAKTMRFICNFVGEVHPGETASLYCGKTGDGKLAYEIRRLDEKETPVFRAELKLD